MNRDDALKLGMVAEAVARMLRRTTDQDKVALHLKRRWIKKWYSSTGMTKDELLKLTHACGLEDAAFVLAHIASEREAELHGG